MCLENQVHIPCVQLWDPLWQVLQWIGRREASCGDSSTHHKAGHLSNDIWQLHILLISQTARFMGPTWGPSGSCRPQMGLVLAPWTLLSGMGQWALHLEHQNRCKLLFSMSFITVLRKNIDRNMRLQSCIWIRAVTSNDDMELYPISNSCNKVTLSLTSLDCYLRIIVCIHRKYGVKSL